MGLDLSMVTKKDYDAVYKEDASWTESIELAYGRKTWAIENFFAERSKELAPHDYVFNVPESAWDEFYETFKDVASYLYDITEEIYLLESLSYPTEADEKRIYELYNSLEKLMNPRFDYNDSYQLGIDWEARAVARWIEAYPAVKEAYKNGEEIYMIASF